MKLDFFEEEGRRFYSAIVWTEQYGDEVSEMYTTLREARVALKRLKREYDKYTITDSYIREYDINGDCVRDYKE